MQGTVWGSMLCKTTMDKLGQLVYKRSDLTYKYKGVVEIPTLGMVDDILSVQKCSEDAVKINAVINGFIEGKKLTLSNKKCNRIHIENKRTRNAKNCPDLKVHENQMKTSLEEKYLGDVVNTSGTIRKTVEERKNKGYGIVSVIIAILE